MSDIQPWEDHWFRKVRGADVDRRCDLRKQFPNEVSADAQARLNLGEEKLVERGLGGERMPEDVTEFQPEIESIPRFNGPPHSAPSSLGLFFTIATLFIQNIVFLCGNLK